ncbi:hypothetical protein [Methylotuvimicrobium alcaliphilum]|nr:hypothetical protein [Methylotuvimicrobium alcaliphilum]
MGIYTFRTSNFGSARGGAGVSDKGFASMELAKAYMDVFTQHLNSIAHWPWLIVLDNLGAGFTASFGGHPGAEF